MPVKLPSGSPIISSIAVSNAVKSNGSNFIAFKIPKKNTNIGSNLSFSSQTNFRNESVGFNNFNINSIIANNGYDFGINYDFINNSSIQHLLSKQPIPLVFANFSSEVREKMLNVLAANKLESQVDRLIFHKIYEIIEKDASGNILLKDSVERLKKNFKECNDMLDALQDLLIAKNQSDQYFEPAYFNASTAAIFKETISSIGVKNYIELLGENYEENNFISIASLLTSHKEQFLLSKDPQFIFWLALNDAKESIQCGLSPGCLIQQNRRDEENFVFANNIKSTYPGFKKLNEIGTGNLSIDTLNDSGNYSIDRIPYPSFNSELDKILYYVGLISNEMLISVGAGIVEGTIEAQKFGASIDPIENSLGAPPAGPNFLANPDTLYATSKINSEGNPATSNQIEAILFSNNQSLGVKFKYIDNFLNNVTKNKLNIYERALNGCNATFDEVEEFLKKVLLQENNKKSLLTKSGLLSRIISDFALIIDDLKNGQDGINTKNACLSLFLLKRFYGNKIDKNINYKLINQKVIALRLNSALTENYESSIELQKKVIKISNGNLNIFNLTEEIKNVMNEKDLGNLISIISSQTQFEKIIDAEQYDFQTLMRLYESSTFDQKYDIYEIVVRIVKDIEEESYKILSEMKPDGTYLKNNGTTKYSGFDSLTIANIIFECFAVLATIFVDMKLIYTPVTGEVYNFTINYNGVSTTDRVGKLEKSSKFLQALSDALANKNTNFLIKNNGIISSDNVTKANENLGFNNETSPRIMVEMANKALAEDVVFWNLYAMSKSLALNAKNSSQSLIRYGKILNKQSAPEINNLSKNEKTILNFVNDSSFNSNDYLSNLSKFSINKSNQKLKELESLQKPYDIADLSDEIYDACITFLKSKSFYSKGKIAAVGFSKNFLNGIQKQSLQKFDDAFLRLKITRSSQFEPNIEYEDLNCNPLRLRYILNEESIKKAIIKLKGRSSTEYSLNDLATEAEFYDFSTGNYLKLPLSDETVAIVESYIVCKLLEINFDLVLEPQFVSSNAYDINYEKLSQATSIIANFFGIENLQNYIFEVNGSESRFFTSEEINKKLENLNKTFDINGNPIFLNSNLNFDLISSIQTLSDSLLFRTDSIKKLVFSNDKIEAIYGLSFDQQSFKIKNNVTKKIDVDFIDAYVISGEIS